MMLPCASFQSHEQHTNKANKIGVKTMNSSATPIRVGLIVPSSNVTIEAELPALLARHESATFTFHSSRMRMQEVSEEAMQAMNAQREGCVAELIDACCDSLVYGCLVAVMANGCGEDNRGRAAVMVR